MISCILFFFAGIFKSGSDTLSFRFDSSWFSNLSYAFWKPEISYKNKYKNGDRNQGARFPGSTTVLVFLTDGWHLFNDLQFYLLATGTVLFIPYLGLSVWTILMYVVILKLCFSIGFNLGYEVIFKK